ncbi:MAG: cadherin-like beta sandwich domain-containing protein [Fibrobacterota bacterium]
MKKIVCFAGAVLLLAFLLGVLSCARDERPVSPLDANTADELQAKGSITGVVRGQDSLPLSGVLITIPGAGYSTVSDSAGGYVLSRVRYGTYSIRFMRYKYIDTSVTGITVALGEHVRLAEAMTVRRFTCIIRGRVVTAGTGAPIPGAGVAVSQQSLSTLSDAVGEFTLSDVDPAARLVLAAQSGVGFGQQSVQMAAGAMLENVVITLNQAGGRISGTVGGSALARTAGTGAAAKARAASYAGIIVSALGGALRDTTDSLGRYLLRNVPSALPIDVSAPPYGTFSGLMVTEGGVLAGVNITPLNAVTAHGVTLRDRRYLVPHDSTVTAEALVEGADRVALFLWDFDNDSTFDSVTTVPFLKLTAALADSQVLRYGVILGTGDTLASARISVLRISEVPRVILGPDLTVAPREMAWLLGSAVCLSGGLRSFSWDFDGNGTFDWTRPDQGLVGHRYFDAGTYYAVFKVTSLQGLTASDTVRILVTGGGQTLPAGQLPPPDITAPGDNDTAAPDFTLCWKNSGAGVTYSVYRNTFSPPESLLATGITDTFLVVNGLTVGQRSCFQVRASRAGDSTAFGLTVSYHIGVNHPPVFTALLPTNDSTLRTDSITLVFPAHDADGNTIHYNLYYGPDSPPGLFRTGLADTLLRVAPTGGGVQNADYYWQVEASDNKDSILSPLRRFIWKRPNQAPSFSTQPGDLDSTVMDDGSLLDTLQASDPDGDHIRFVKLSGPVGLLLTDSIFSYTASMADTGLHTLAFAVLDSFDGADTLSRSLRVVHRKSTDATLSGLVPSAGALTPVFSAAVRNYSDTVPADSVLYRLTPQAAHPHARIAVNDSTVLSGNASPSFSLAAGQNLLIVTVTAEDGITQRTYLLSIFRPKSSDTYLRTLSVSAGTLRPSFDPLVFNYADTLPATTDSLRLSVAARNPFATFQLGDTTLNVSGFLWTEPLWNINTRLQFQVIAEDDTSTRVYYVDIYRAPSTDAALVNLTMTPGTLSPVFDSLTFTYAETLQYDDSTVSLTPFAHHFGASITIGSQGASSGYPSSPLPLSVGDNAMVVGVQAEDGISAKSYTVNVHRKSSPPVITGLADSTLDAGRGFSMLMLDNFVTDKDNPATSLTWNARVLHGFGTLQGVSINIDPMYHYANFSLPDTSWFGMDSIIFTVTDPSGLSDTDTVVYRKAGWRLFTPGAADTILAMAFPTYNIGYIAGVGGQIFKSTDHGVTWTPQTSNTPHTLRALSFTDALHGCVVGDSGMIRMTANGGATWTAPVSSVPMGRLTAVGFTNSTHGWAAGLPNGGPVIIRTTDGGLHWVTGDPSSRCSGTPAGLHVASGAIAQFVNASSTVFRTADSGATWASSSMSANGLLYDLFFVDDSTGWACGDNGEIRKTVNRGQSWTNQTRFSMAPYTGVHFSDKNTGWIVGNNILYGSIVLRTENGGASWTNFYVSPNPVVTDVATFGARDMIMNDRNVLLHYAVQPNPAFP